MTVYRSGAQAKPLVFEPLLRSEELDAERDSERFERTVEEAYRRGIEEGKALASKEIDSALKALASAAAQLESENRNQLLRAQHDLIRLSLAIARRVVMAELSARPELIERVVANVLKEIETKKVTAIILHPDDAEIVTRSPLIEEVRSLGISIEARPDIARGGCIVESSIGRLDARLETRIEEVEAALLEPTERTT